MNLQEMTTISMIWISMVNKLTVLYNFAYFLKVMKTWRSLENQDQHIDDLLNSEPKREDTVGGIDSTQKIYDELPEFFIGSNNEKVLKNGTARFTGTNICL